MELKIYKDHETLSQRAAEEILKVVTNNPAAVLCLATGDTPKLTYQLLVEKALEEKTDFSRCTFIGLDEWIGIGPDQEGSCRFFLENRLFKPLQIQADRIHLFDGMATDLEAECKKMNEIVAATSGIDLMLVGVGLNGHIGFNEPGTPFEANTHVIDLHTVTQSVGQKYFTETVKIRQGITLGLQQVLQSKHLLMLANGVRKAEIMKSTFEDSISPQLPASITRMHPHSKAMLDAEAAGLLDAQSIAEGVFMQQVP